MLAGLLVLCARASIGARKNTALVLICSLQENGVRVVIVEDASRFARHLLTQEAGIALLVGLGVRVMTAAGDDLTDNDDEFRVAMRQIMGVFSQLEKTRLVKKVEGRKSHLEKRLSLGTASELEYRPISVRPRTICKALIWVSAE
jgi:DNA invertase Pin-like site-specific DNA recombinase